MFTKQVHKSTMYVATTVTYFENQLILDKKFNQMFINIKNTVQVVLKMVNSAHT